MEQRKTNKKKLVIALALLALIVVASVITTVVLVLAAQTQNVNSNVNVTYTVTDVTVRASAQYGAATDAALKDMTVDGTSTGQTAHIFTADADTTTASLQLVSPTNEPTTNPGVISLQSTSPYAIFAYKFENMSEEIAANIKFKYTDDDPTGAKKDTNVVYGYTTSTAADGIALADLQKVSYVAPDADSDKDWAVTGEGFAINPLTSGTFSAETKCSTTLYIYVFVMVDDLTTAASFSGAFDFVLTATAI